MYVASCASIIHVRVGWYGTVTLVCTARLEGRWLVQWTVGPVELLQIW